MHAASNKTCPSDTLGFPGGMSTDTAGATLVSSSLVPDSFMVCVLSQHAMMLEVSPLGAHLDFRIDRKQSSHHRPPVQITAPECQRWT
mmetsp:Transcript_59139/g.125376  ORF Transcript_59139/g.125376 Transcript_59139/m.125376 type:complete len:88 (-) Transcript_59139:573-836(-)